MYRFDATHHQTNRHRLLRRTPHRVPGPAEAHRQPPGATPEGPDSGTRQLGVRWRPRPRHRGTGLRPRQPGRPQRGGPKRTGVLIMQKHNIQIGTTYIVKVSGTLAEVRITREHPRGGWYGTNLATGREIRIRTAARLRSEVKPAEHTEKSRSRRSPDFSADELRQVVERAKAEILADVASGTVPS